MKFELLGPGPVHMFKGTPVAPLVRAETYPVGSQVDGPDNKVSIFKV